MADQPPLVDTNVILRHLLQDQPDQSLRASAFFERVESGGLEVRIIDQVLFETAFTLQSLYRATKHQIRDVLLPLVQLPSVRVQSKEVWRTTLARFANSRLSLVDAYQIGIMERDGCSEIVSFDRDFDAVPGVTRVEP